MHRPCAELGLVGVYLDLDGLGLTLGVVVDDDLEGPEHRHGSGGVGVQVISDAGLEQAVIDNAVSL